MWLLFQSQSSAKLSCTVFPKCFSIGCLDLFLRGCSNLIRQNANLSIIVNMIMNTTIAVVLPHNKCVTDNLKVTFNSSRWYLVDFGSLSSRHQWRIQDILLGGANIRHTCFSAKMCAKTKELGFVGGGAPPGSATGHDIFVYSRSHQINNRSLDKLNAVLQVSCFGTKDT